MTKEQQIESYMKKLNISKEEAIQLWEDDQEDYIGEAGEEMQAKAKDLKRHYEKAETPKRKSTSKKERKIDEDKKELLEIFSEALKNAEIEINSIQTETEINFDFKNANYTLKLTKHRKKKGGE